MKRLVASLVFGLIALSGCGVFPENSTRVETVPVVLNPEGLYVEYIQSKYPEISADQALKLGDATCNAFDTGITVRDMYAGLEDLNIDEEKIGTVIGGAVNYLCPQHIDKIKPKS